jgi:hypothetical protein
VEELAIMAAGPYAVDGVESAGRGTEAATAFLDRLRALADVHDVVVLSYADVDAEALVAGGMTDVLVRSLPRSGTGAPDADDGAPPAEPAGTGAGTGTGIVSEILDVAPRTDLAWAAGGALGPETLDVLQSRGTEQVVLGSAGLSEGRSSVGLAGDVAAAHTSLTTAGGPLDALVADAGLTAVVGAAEQAAGGARLAEQRYLAELATLTMQAPEGTEQTVLVAPPRDVEASPEGAGAMMADTASLLSWLRPVSLEELAAVPSAPAGEAVDPGDAVRLDPAGLGEVAAAVAARQDLAGAVIGDADAALAAFDAATSRTVSAAWRADPEGFREAANGLRGAMDRLRGRVTLLAPADGTYTLASGDAALVLTVQNDLPFAVEVLLRIQTRSRGLTVQPLEAQSLAPGERTTLQVPTEVRQSGGFAVTAELTTPGGQLLGERVQMQVKSTAYGSISLLITFGAAALLALLFLRRLVRFLLRRRRAAASPDGGIPPEAPPVGPPTRSPV